MRSCRGKRRRRSARSTRGRGSCGSSTLEIGKKLFERSQARGIHHAQETHFQVQTRIRLAAKVLARVQKNLKKSSKVFLAEQFRRFLQSRTLVGGRGNQF